MLRKVGEAMTASSSASLSSSSGSFKRRLLAAHHLLPGRLRVERGTFADYRALAHFHYAAGRPAVTAGVWRVVYEERRLGNVDCRLWDEDSRGDQGLRSSTSDDQHSRLYAQYSPLRLDHSPRLRARTVAVGVLAFPTPASRARERTLHLTGPRYGAKLAFVNAHVRTIARIIVHPQFRSLGVAARLVRRICDECPTRYVEAFAAMGEVHPFFERGGMRRVAAADDREAAYFIFDREEGGRHAK
jgi:GNAT superfamily N-acetyltransferase